MKEDTQSKSCIIFMFKKEETKMDYLSFLTLLTKEETKRAFFVNHITGRTQRCLYDIVFYSPRQKDNMKLSPLAKQDTKSI